MIDIGARRNYSLVYLFVQVFIECQLCTVTTLDAPMNKIDKTPSLMNITLEWKETDNKHK